MEYTLAFLFTEDLRKVWMIEKQHPEWQKGLLNGIGGKIQPGEDRKLSCIREIKEEAGVVVSPNDIKAVGRISGEGYEVHVFTGKTDQVLSTQEQEQILLIPLISMRLHMCVDNVPMLVETCKHFLQSNYSISEAQFIY